ncbi:MAG: glycosyl transferase [Enterovirga sp.]|nr:glycosyl transferase [Enterovirga sp.]
MITASRPASAFPRASTHPLAGRTILQIIPELDAGGAERTAIDVAAGLAEIGARALVASEGGRLVGELQAHGGVWIPFPAGTKSPFAMLANVRKLARIAYHERADLIHARSRAPAWVGLGAARSLGIPFVTTFHGAYAGRSGPKRLYNSVMARGDVVIANSGFTAGLVKSVYGTPPERIVTLQRGTDLAEFSPAAVAAERVDALRRKWEVAPHERIVLLAGRLTGWKGQKVLIEAAARLRRRGVRDIVYILAGDHQGRDGYVKELDRLIGERGLTGIVRRVGHCTDMPAAYLAASIVAVPSTEPEAFGRVAVEAQAMGTPVVVSNLGAVPETVLAPPEATPARRTGWRVPAGDADALAEALDEVLSLGASAQEGLAQRARTHVEQHFSLEAMISGTLAVYGELLAARRKA